MDDARFDYGPVPAWRRGGKQTVHSTYVTEVEDNNVFEPHPTQLEWTFDTKNPVIFDSLTRFHVDVSISVSTRTYMAGVPAVEAVAAVAARAAVAAVPAAPGQAAVAAVPSRAAVAAVAARAAVPPQIGEWGDFEDCVADAEWQNFRLAPCWWELFFKSWDLSYYNDQPKQHSESQFIPYRLNTLLYWVMDPDLKDYLCPEPWHPGRAVPSATGKWDFSENGAWHKYAQKLLLGGTVRFTWKPLHFWPMYQGTNDGIQEGFRPRALPVSKLPNKLIMRAQMVDKLDNVFRVADAHVNTRRYKIDITKFQLCVEEARLNPAADRALISKTLFWPGVCKMMRNEWIPAGTFVHNIRFDEALWPELILIFALHKNVTGGSEKYQTHADQAPHFLQHNIEQVTLKYGTYSTSQNVPNFGTVGDVHAERNVVRSYKQAGLFGMKVDPEIVNNISAQNGFALTEFPHVIMHLIQTDGLEEDQPRSRTVPLLTDASIIEGKPKDLLINLKFYTPAGCPDNSTFIVYLGYTDTNMMLKDRKFVSPYGLH